MKKAAKLLLLSYVLLVVSPPAFASYIDGAWGWVILIISVPIAFVALLVTILFLSSGWFKNERNFVIYCTMCGLVALGAVLLSTSADDPASIWEVLFGEAVLLIPVILPAYIQLRRARRFGTTQQGAPVDAKRRRD